MKQPTSQAATLAVRSPDPMNAPFHAPAADRAVEWGTPLGQANGIQYWLCTATDLARKELLAEVVKAAWLHDYQGRAIFKFDPDYIGWLTPPGASFLVVATDRRGRPVGCEVAIDRQLRAGGRTLRVSYVTLLTVHPALRGQGVAQGLLDHITGEAVRRGSDLVLSVFDSDAAGEGTVKKFLATRLAREWSIALSPPFTMWAATPDLAQVDRYEPLRGAARAALWPGLRRLLQAPRRAAPRGRIEEDAVGWAVGSAGDDVAAEMLASEGLAAMYPRAERAGAACVRSTPDGRETGCSIAYHLPEIVRTGAPDGRMCQVQLVRPPPSAAELAASLQTFNDAMFARGVLCTFLANTARLPALALLRAHFVPTERKIRVALRGPRALLGGLDLGGGRWVVDVL